MALLSSGSLTTQFGGGLTIRRSRPPTAAAELRALVPLPALCRPLFIPGFCLSQRFLLWGLGRSPGFACWLGVSFKPFGPLALASQAPAAIILAALRRFRGSVLFHGPRPSSSQGAPFWPSGLTVRRSRPPTAAAELRALAFRAFACPLHGPWLLYPLSFIRRFCRWCSVALRGCACWQGQFSKLFWPSPCVHIRLLALFFIASAVWLVSFSTLPLTRQSS